MLDPKSICKYSEAINKFNDYPIYKAGMEWLANFIGKPHPDLGRSGAICPFVPPSIKKDFVTFCVINTETHTDKEAFEKISPLVEFFHQLEPTYGPDNAIKCAVAFFPDINPYHAKDFIDKGHAILKKHFVANGLMIGEFHILSRVPGYYNDNFNPMTSPVPAFAIRNMSIHDIQFLNNEMDPIETRIYYLSHYLKFVGNKLNKKQLENTERLFKKLTAQHTGLAND